MPAQPAIRLRDLDAGLTILDYGNGVRLTALLFDCPNPRCGRGHAQGIPYSDAPFHEVPDPRSRPGGVLRNIKVWQRTSGTTIDDLTLAPSFVVASCDGLHGHVRGGSWVPC